MDSLPKQKKLIPISEAAKVLGMSIDTVRRWDKSGVLHSERPDGKNRYFSLNELEQHKFHQPLPISEVAKQLSVSATTLRRLEARGLIKPKRNNAGERVYDQDLLKKFLNSDYFLRKKQIKEKVLEPLQEEKELTDSITPETEPVIPRVDLKPRSSLPDFLVISIAVFLLLTTLGVGNIKLSEAKTQEVLGKKVEVSAAPADGVTAQPAETKAATAEATPKTTVTIKIDDNSPSVNIRQKPAINSTKIGQAKDGNTFEFVSKAAGWYEIKLADGSTGFTSETGFISAKYIREQTN